MDDADLLQAFDSQIRRRIWESKACSRSASSMSATLGTAGWLQRPLSRPPTSSGAFRQVPPV
jgi:hypothetical protein